MSQLIYHHYPQSPVAMKLRVCFGLLGLDWDEVEIPRVPPKPLLMPLTGGYRRTPVLQIGSDIYLDSQNIALELGTRYPALFASSDGARDLQLGHYCGVHLFGLAVRLVISSVIGTAPDGFIQDRASIYFDAGWNPEDMQARIPSFALQLQAGLSEMDRILAAQKEKGEDFLLGSKASYADAALRQLTWFIGGRWDQGPDFLNGFDHLNAHGAAMDDLGEGRIAHTLSGEDALGVALNSAPESPTGIKAAFTGGLEIGQQVSVRQHVPSADPDVVGRLRYLDARRVSLDIENEEAGHVAVHFPVLDYAVMPA